MSAAERGLRGLVVEKVCLGDIYFSHAVVVEDEIVGRGRGFWEYLGGGHE